MAVLTILVILPLYCINHMDLIQTMSGEFAGSEFGINMVSMDYNGDGYQDLIVSSSGWNPYGAYADSSRYGKLYFYWGGSNFDNIPDFTLTGIYDGDFETLREDLSNVGDVNGDGIEDLALSSYTVNNDWKVAIFYGRQYPQTTPDLVQIYPSPEWSFVGFFPLGDINGDGHDDIALMFQGGSYQYNKIMIWTDVTSQPWFFRQTSNRFSPLLMNGIGDVNADGVDDCFMHLPLDGLGSINKKLVVFYGNSNFSICDSLVISENTNQAATWWGCSLGDVNGDGIDDFEAFNYHLWLGSSGLTSNWNVELVSPYGFSEGGSGFPFIYGDLNNDGYDEVVGSNHMYGSWSGVANVWMGRSQMNGTLDLHIFPPENYRWRNFGWAKATGDYNADGYCDIAVSAPWWGTNDHNETGKVFVYAGNAELADTTVGVEDDTIPVPDVSNWDISISPNPVTNKLSQLNIQFTGSGYKNAINLKVSIFDIKGRKLLSKSIPDSKLREGNWSISLKGIKPGLCILNISDGNNKLITRSFIIN